MITLSSPFRDHQPLRVVPRTHFLNVGGDAVLFGEGSQQIAKMASDLAASATHLRSDVQQVGYLSPPSTVGEVPAPIAFTRLLTRAERSTTRIETMTWLGVLKAALNSPYALRGGISGAGFKGLTEVIGEVRIGQLCFSDWRDGRRLVEALAA